MNRSAQLQNFHLLYSTAELYGRAKVLDEIKKIAPLHAARLNSRLSVIVENQRVINDASRRIDLLPTLELQRDTAASLQLYLFAQYAKTVGRRPLPYQLAFLRSLGVLS